MTATLFVVFVVLMTAISVMLIARYLNASSAARVLTRLLVWFAYVGFMGYSGIARNTTTRPPAVVFLIGPILLFLAFFIVRFSFKAKIALAFPLWILLGTQSFRIGVEMFLHQLWLDGLIPRMLTFEGANFDIFVGASAPLIAWLSTRGRVGLKLALTWNVLGFLALVNVVVRAVLTAPGPLNLIHAEVPDLMIGRFPFLFIPGFFVPLAVILHVLAIVNIVSQLSVLVSSKSLNIDRDRT